MGSHQTALCSKDGTLAVALNRTAFQHKVQMVFVLALDKSLVIEVTIDLVVEFCLKFLAPAVELEVKKEFGGER